MIPLSHSDAVRLRAAQGWLMLHDPIEAQRELDSIGPAAESRREVLRLRWEICAVCGRWSCALELARVLCRLNPSEVSGWIYLARALRALNQPAQAVQVLLQLAVKFSDQWSVPYQIACCQSTLGELDQSAEWLRRAFRLTPDPNLPYQARAETDLRPLWPRLQELQH